MWDIEIKLNRLASQRIKVMKDALEDFQKGKISRQKFAGVLRKQTTFNGDVWEADYDYVEQNRVFQAEQNIKDEAKGIVPQPTERQLLALRLKMPESSMIVGKVVSGELTEEEAMPICDAIRHRHTQTAYDELLESGVSKEDAREIIRQ